MYFTNELKIYFLSLLITIEQALDFADPSIVKDECKMNDPSVRPCSRRSRRRIESGRGYRIFPMSCKTELKNCNVS